MFHSNKANKVPNEPHIFISHSSKDLYAVKLFTDFLIKAGVPEKRIICSSVEPFHIPFGKNIFEYLSNHLSNEKLVAIFFLSYNYYMSPVCLNEMGAVWIKKSEAYSFILPGFRYDDIQGVIDNHAIGIDLSKNEYGKFNDFKRMLQMCFEINISDTLWQKIVTEFLADLQSKATEHNTFDLLHSETFCIGEYYSDGLNLIRKDSTPSKAVLSLDFNKVKCELCSLCVYVEQKNWLYLASKDKKLSFDIYSEKSSGKVRLEIHGKAENAHYQILLENDKKSYNIPLKSFTASMDIWNEVKEICFVFSRRELDVPDKIIIENLRIE